MLEWKPETVAARDDVDEPAVWFYLQWGRLAPEIAGAVDHTQASTVYVSLAGKRDRVRRYLTWLEQQAGPEAAERAHARARSAARTGPPPRRARRLRVVAKD